MNYDIMYTISNFLPNNRNLLCMNKVKISKMNIDITDNGDTDIHPWPQNDFC